MLPHLGGGGQTYICLMLSLEFGSESIVSSSVTRSCAGRSVSLFRGDQNTARVMVFYECGREDGLAY